MDNILGKMIVLRISGTRAAITDPWKRKSLATLAPGLDLSTEKTYEYFVFVNHLCLSPYYPLLRRMYKQKVDGYEIHVEAFVHVCMTACAFLATSLVRDLVGQGVVDVKGNEHTSILENDFRGV